MRFGYNPDEKTIIIASETDTETAQLGALAHVLASAKVSHTMSGQTAENLWGEPQQRVVIGLKATEQMIIVSENPEAQNAAREIAQKAFMDSQKTPGGK